VQDGALGTGRERSGEDQAAAASGDPEGPRPADVSAHCRARSRVKLMTQNRDQLKTGIP